MWLRPKTRAYDVYGDCQCPAVIQRVGENGSTSMFSPPIKILFCSEFGPETELCRKNSLLIMDSLMSWRARRLARAARLTR